MSSEGLVDNSSVYESDVQLYHQFAMAEDHPGLIANAITHRFHNKTVLDLGCGTGKYIQIFAPLAKEYIAIDRAEAMLCFAQKNAQGLMNVKFLHADAEAIPLKNEAVDLVFSSWGMGAIVDDAKRVRVLKEIHRVLKKDGEILIIENDIGGEFERVRGRYPNSIQTENYHNWLKNIAGLKQIENLNTYFKFNSAEEAQRCFASIWGERLCTPPKSSLIEHKIAIFDSNVDLLQLL